VAVLRTAPEPAAAATKPAASGLFLEQPTRKPSPPLPSAMPPEPLYFRAVLAGWVASFMLLAALAWAAYAWRAGIMHAWPASERAYALLGLLPR
jgi:hypothetical protein